MISARRAREADLDKALFGAFADGAQSIRAGADIPAPISGSQHPSSSRQSNKPYGKAGCNVSRFRARQAQELEENSSGKQQNDHRTAHLEHAERPQDIGGAGGDGAA